MGEAGAGDSTPRPRLRQAIGWAYLMDVGGQVLSALFTFVLAAMLGPEAFGVVALAVVYVLFIEMLQRQGMVAALVQRKTLSESHLDSAFWMLVCVSALLTIASIALSGWWAQVNNTPLLQQVVIALSALLPIQALVLVQDAVLRRSLQFRALAVRNTVAALAGGACGVAAAIGGLGVWSLVVQQLVGAAVSLLLLWRMADWRPRLRFSIASLRDLLGFSTGSFFTSVAVFVNNRADALLTGLFFGPIAIGLYRLAYRVLDQVLALSMSGMSLASVALSELSHHQDDDERFAERVDTFLHLSAASALPLLGVLCAVAGPLLGVVGEQWLPATNALRALCIVGAIRAVVELVGPVLQARGHPHRQAVLTWSLAALSAGSYVAVGLLLRDASSTAQVVSMALSRALVYTVILGPLTLAIISRYGGVTPRLVGRTVAGPAFASVVGCLAGLATLHVLPPATSRPAQLVALLVTGSVSSAVTLIALVAVDARARPLLRELWRRLRVVDAGIIERSGVQ